MMRCIVTVWIYTRSWRFFAFFFVQIARLLSCRSIVSLLCIRRSICFPLVPFSSLSAILACRYFLQLVQWCT
ncbi:hypothetical protein DFH27DRAFT_211810 [Peziza echinospora]|nr:hypothetical protein DFH27DRAFT_211810 [Peziza echinospora]